MTQPVVVCFDLSDFGRRLLEPLLSHVQTFVHEVARRSRALSLSFLRKSSSTTLIRRCLLIQDTSLRGHYVLPRRENNFILFSHLVGDVLVLKSDPFSELSRPRVYTKTSSVGLLS